MGKQTFQRTFCGFSATIMVLPLSILRTVG